MRVEKWGDTLAVRLPDDVVRRLGPKQGDEVEIEIGGKRTREPATRRTREQALARLKALSLPLPPGFRFSRDDCERARTRPKQHVASGTLFRDAAITLRFTMSKNGRFPIAGSEQKSNNNHTVPASARS